MSDEERYYEQLAAEREQEERARADLHSILVVLGPAEVLKLTADWLTRPLTRPLTPGEEPF